MNDNKEAKSLTCRRGSEVSQVGVILALTPDLFVGPGSPEQGFMVFGI